MKTLPIGNKKKKKCERTCVKLSFQEQTGNFLTIGQCAEDGCRTEAAITGHGARPNLHFVLSGPAEVRQHGLVSVALSVVALIFTSPLLS